MDKKFHLVNGEPKPCKANIRDCPVGGEHFATKAEARASYDAENKSNMFKNITKKVSTRGNNKDSYERMVARDKRNGIFATGGAVVALAGLAAGIGLSIHQSDVAHNNAGAEYAKTPYSVSVTTHEHFGPYSYSAKIMNSNLKETNFEKCVNHEDNSFNTKGDTLTCKTVDGKFQVSIKHGGKGDRFSKASIIIRDGKINQTISNVKIDNSGSPDYIIPASSGSLNKNTSLLKKSLLYNKATMVILL